MASITDCVVEGLKYPFNDIKKTLIIGVLFSILNLISLAIGVRTFNLYRTSIKIADGGIFSLQFSQLPVSDIYIMIALAVISIIISLFIMGYRYNVVKFSITQKEELPGFNNILNIIICGVKYFIAALAYSIIPILALVIGVVLFGDSSILLINFVISIILFVIAFFLLIMALSNMIAHDKLAKAFDLREILANIKNLGWGKYIGIIIFTSIVHMIIIISTGLILSFLSTIFASIVNNPALIVIAFTTAIEGLLITSYCKVFLSRVCGSIYRESIK